MKILGIITEFNPFHNGHKYFLEKVKTECEFDAIVCVMSGSFTQRGEPAICNKWSRAEMALENGVDLVIELPFTFASRSAHYFAYGAVQLLERTGVISHLAFGSEINNLTTLEKISRLLNHEPNEYKAILTAFLAKGLSYPVARSQALQEFFNDPNISEVLIGSNNILGIEYLRSLGCRY